MMKHPAITDVVSHKSDQKTLIVADRKTWRKKTRDAVIYGVLLSLVVILLNIGQGFTVGLHMKEKVMAQTAEAYASLVSGSKALFAGDRDGAAADFTAAQEQFASLQTMLSVLTPQLQKGGFSLLDSGRFFFDGSEKLAQTAEVGASLFTAATTWSKNFADANQTALNGASAPQNESLTQQLATVFEQMPSVIDAVAGAEQSFDRVALTDIPTKYQELFQTLTKSVRAVHDTLEGIYNEKDAFLTLLGDGTSKKYMVLLQNNSEQRPTGGFIGSFLLIDVKDGVIGPLSFNDVYDYDWRLAEDVQTPEEIAALTDNWRLRDANYSPDFPTSAQQAMWFLQKEDGPKVDGVIGLDLTVLENLLQLSGPVQLNRFTEPLTADNIQLILSAVIESKLDGVESPKQIFHDLIPAVVQTAFAHPPSLGSTLGVINTLRAQGHVQAYFTDSNLEEATRTLGIAGEVTPPATGDDVLQVVHTSIGGNKTDAFVTENVVHRTFIGSDGSVTDQVTITRTHTWTDEIGKQQQDTIASFGLPALSDAVRSILGFGVNKSALRVYVPKDTELVSVLGIDEKDIQTIQDDDVGQTYFRFVMETSPGTTSTVTVNYLLPFTMAVTPFAEYHFIMRPQPGATQQTMAHQFVLADTLQIYAERAVALTKTLGTQYAALIGRN